MPPSICPWRTMSPEFSITEPSLVMESLMPSGRTKKNPTCCLGLAAGPRYGAVWRIRVRYARRSCRALGGGPRHVLLGLAIRPVDAVSVPRLRPLRGTLGGRHPTRQRSPLVRVRARRPCACDHAEACPCRLADDQWTVLRPDRWQDQYIVSLQECAHFFWWNRAKPGDARVGRCLGHHRVSESGVGRKSGA